MINHDLPMVAEDYVHRIGRTGRNGMEGEAISLVSPEEGPLLKQIQKLLKSEIEIKHVRGFELDRPLKLDGPMPSNGGNRGRGKPAGQGAPRKPAGAKPAHRAHGKPQQGQNGQPRSAKPHAGAKPSGGRGRGPRRPAASA